MGGKRTGSNALRIEFCTRREHLDPYRVAWDGLTRRAPNSDLFSSFEWITSWLDAFWRSKPLMFAFVWRGEQLVGLAPLLDDQEGDLCCPGTLVLPVNQYAAWSDFAYLEPPETVLAAIWRDLCTFRPKPLIGLTHLPHDSPTLVALSRYKEMLAISCHTCHVDPSPRLKVATDWTDYIKSRSRECQRELRRKHRRLSRAGGLKFVNRTQEDECANAIVDTLAIETRSLKQKAGSSATIRPDLTQFYKVLTLKAARRNWWRSFMLYVDDRPAAHIFGMVHGNVFYALKTSYDRAFAEYSPTYLLLERVIRRGFEAGLSAFEFHGMPTRWKEELANGVRERRSACLYWYGSIRCKLCGVYHSTAKPPLMRHLPSLLDRTKRGPKKPT
ncbi:MAG: GNAT family N-acetyltransferase [Planctomycetota bacterium]